MGSEQHESVLYVGLMGVPSKWDDPIYRSGK
jgi:hypothetical protein